MYKRICFNRRPCNKACSVPSFNSRYVQSNRYYTLKDIEITCIFDVPFMIRCPIKSASFYCQKKIYILYSIKFRITYS